MRRSAIASLAWRSAGVLLLLGGAALAQQPAGDTASSAPRRGYFTRLQTQSSGAAPARASRAGGRLDAAAVAGRGGSGEGLFRTEPDPLRPYGEPARASSGSLRRPYEPAPPPPREVPAPPESHNYYPGLRSGQGPNRNVRCVPGRHVILHR
jgi:hypothetical protein